MSKTSFQFSKRKNQADLEGLHIGNMADVFPTKIELAAKLNISAADISVFETTGNDIYAKLTSDFSLLSNNTFGGTNLTYFRDYENRGIGSIGVGMFANTNLLNDLIINQFTQAAHSLCRFSKIKSFSANSLTELLLRSFEGATEIESIDLPELLKATASSAFSGVWAGCTKLASVNIPKCTQLGASPSTSGTFLNCAQGLEVTVDASMATNNGGQPDADLQYVINTLNGTVNYVIN